MIPDLAHALDAYCLGLEAQLSLLETLARAAAAQHEACQRRDAGALAAASDARERIMDALVSLESSQRPLRDRLVNDLPTARGFSAFESVARLHRRAEACLAQVAASDRDTLLRLGQTEETRRAAAHAIEAGEVTLAAYRKILSVESRSALVDRRG